MKVDKRYIGGLIKKLNKYCFTEADKEYKRRTGKRPVLKLTPQGTLSKSPNFDPEEYAKCCNWSYKRAQRIIINNRLKIETAVKNDSINCVNPYTTSYILRLLTDYANCVAWVLLGHDLSRVRSAFLQPASHSPLHEHNWASVDNMIKRLNNNPHKVALATDLTSFVHAGT